ncbi:MAG TPA: tetratricopeptide repeat protein [Polyangia bacterium]|nr:tetratricopeptide repeat protein [Polyangia bacterium]
MSVLPCTTALGHQAAPDAAPSDNAQRARELFRQGGARYYLGDYEGSLALFQKAYELSSEAPLLFNIAQAYRLAGHCQKALENYRLFVKLDPTSDLRPAAEQRIEALSVTCQKENPPTVVPTLTAPPPTTLAEQVPVKPLQSDTVSAPSQFWTRSKLKWTSAALGVAVGVAAVPLSLWNNGRYDQWQKEDRRLSMNPPSMETAAAFAAQQDANDTRLRSIQRTDHGILALVGVSVLFLVGAAVLGLVPGGSGTPGPN